MATTLRWGLRYPALTDTADVPRDIGNLATDLDGVAFDDQGTAANCPVSTPQTPGKKGRYYWATDALLLFRDNGTGWNTINPTLAVDGAPGVGTLRTLGSGPQQAAPGNDARLTDQRTPLDASVTVGKVSPLLIPSQGASGNAETLRAIGTAAGQVVAGSDPKLTDQRTPLNGSVTLPKLAADATAKLGGARYFVTEPGSDYLRDGDSTPSGSIFSLISPAYQRRLTVSGGDIFIGFSCRYSVSNVPPGRAAFAILVDGVQTGRIGNAATTGIGETDVEFRFAMTLTGIPAGSHLFALHFRRVSGANRSQIWGPELEIREVLPGSGNTGTAS